MCMQHITPVADAGSLVLQAVQFLKDCDVDGALIVTTPQEVSIIDVRKEINFCKKARFALTLSAGSGARLEHASTLAPTSMCCVAALADPAEPLHHLHVQRLLGFLPART